jgi:hypothetical protein
VTKWQKFLLVYLFCTYPNSVLKISPKIIFANSKHFRIFAEISQTHILYMKRKYQSTGFARFLLMLLIATPVAYIGASYYTGKDGIAEIKSIFTPKPTEVIPPPAPVIQVSPPAAPVVPAPIVAVQPVQDENLVDSQVQKYKDEITMQQKRLDTLYLQNIALKKSIEQKDERLRTLEEQLAKINALIKQ